jgi:hypothetical protein
MITLREVLVDARTFETNRATSGEGITSELGRIILMAVRPEERARRGATQVMARPAWVGLHGETWKREKNVTFCYR